MPALNNVTDMDSHEEQLDGNLGEKRADYLVWDEFFMASAFLVAQRSKDPVTQEGACIVNPEGRMVGVGYNGMPRGCSDDSFPGTNNYLEELNNKDLYVCHAEINAIVHCTSPDVRNCMMYVGVFPCNECCKAIIQSGIKEVVYIVDRQQDEVITNASNYMFAAARVRTRKFTPNHERIVLNFTRFSEIA